MFMCPSVWAIAEATASTAPERKTCAYVLCFAARASAFDRVRNPSKLIRQLLGKFMPKGGKYSGLSARRRERAGRISKCEKGTTWRQGSSRRAVGLGCPPRRYERRDLVGTPAFARPTAARRKTSLEALPHLARTSQRTIAPRTDFSLGKSHGVGRYSCAAHARSGHSRRSQLERL